MTKFNDQHLNLKLKEKEFIEYKELFNWWDNKLYDENEITIEADTFAWSRFATKNNQLASNPPWGFVAKIKFNHPENFYGKVRLVKLFIKANIN